MGAIRNFSYAFRDDRDTDYYNSTTFRRAYAAACKYSHLPWEKYENSNLYLRMDLLGLLFHERDDFLTFGQIKRQIVRREVVGQGCLQRYNAERYLSKFLQNAAANNFIWTEISKYNSNVNAYKFNSSLENLFLFELLENQKFVEFMHRTSIKLPTLWRICKILEFYKKHEMFTRQELQAAVPIFQRRANYYEILNLLVDAELLRKRVLADGHTIIYYRT